MPQVTIKETETAGEHGDYKLLHWFVGTTWKAFTTVWDYGRSRAVIPVSRAAGKKSFTALYTASQTNQAVLSPETGKKLQVAGVAWSTEADSGEITLQFKTSSKYVLKGYIGMYAHQESLDTSLEGGVNEALTLDSTQGDNELFLLVNYRSID